MGRTLRFAPGMIVAMDKGYVDYAWWKEMCDEGVYFVTRLKQDLKYKIIQEIAIPENSKIGGDHLIEIEATPQRPFTLVLRVVTIWDEENGACQAL